MVFFCMDMIMAKGSSVRVSGSSRTLLGSLTSQSGSLKNLDSNMIKQLGEIKAGQKLSTEQFGALQKSLDELKVSKTSKGLSFGKTVTIAAIALGTTYVGKKLYDQNKKANFKGNVKKIRDRGSNKAEVTYEPDILLNKKDKVKLEQTNSTVTLDGTHDIVPLTRASFQVSGKSITSEGDQGTMVVEPSSLTEAIGQDVKNLSGDIAEAILDIFGLAEWGQYIKWGFSASLSCVLCLLVAFVIMKFTSDY